MRVGTGLYMYDRRKKVHVRYLISWWVSCHSTVIGHSCPQWMD